jgi:hypothetical protein
MKNLNNKKIETLEQMKTRKWLHFAGFFLFTAITMISNIDNPRIMFTSAGVMISIFFFVGFMMYDNNIERGNYD